MFFLFLPLPPLLHLLESAAGVPEALAGFALACFGASKQISKTLTAWYRRVTGVRESAEVS